MAKRVKIKFKRNAFREIRNDYRLRRDILERAERIAEAAASMGSEDGKPVKGYKVTDLVLEENRAAASVMATRKAHHHNREHNTLIRALDAGKG